MINQTFTINTTSTFRYKFNTGPNQSLVHNQLSTMVRPVISTLAFTTIQIIRSSHMARHTNETNIPIRHKQLIVSTTAKDITNNDQNRRAIINSTKSVRNRAFLNLRQRLRTRNSYGNHRPEIRENRSNRAKTPYTN